jgi:hypothetical protein
MILIGTNNKTLPLPQQQLNDLKIKNSSSFPQTLKLKKQQKQQNLLSQRPPIIDRKKNFQEKNNNFNCIVSSKFSSFPSCTTSTCSSTLTCSNSSSIVPLLVGNSTTLINKSPQQYRTQNICNSGTFEQMKKYQQQPQTGF